MSSAATDARTAAAVNAAAVTRDYTINPRVEYQTITGVEVSNRA